MRIAKIVAVLVISAGCAPASDRAPAPGDPAAAAAPRESVAPAPEPPGGDPVAVIRGYYAAIAAGDYARAWRAWGNDGAASGQTFDAFRAGFADTRHVEVEVGPPGAIEGAAGSLFVEIPVVVSAESHAGERRRFTGTYTLRRANDVPGSTAEQRRWHLAGARLRRVPLEN